ncbi:MAG TPA: TolC family protein [Candidatus Acidoferrales bacterium]|nr:TolC family protein [Candidatus Acidoferrales bacterium]
MTGRLIRIAVALYLMTWMAVGMPAYAQAAGQQSTQSNGQASSSAQAPSSIPYPNLLAGQDFSKGKRAFPNFFAPYTRRFVPQPNLVNTPTIYGLVRDGKLDLSLQDAIALDLQNDLNITVAEYTPWIDQTQLLNAEGGGTPLGQFVIGGGGGGTFDPVVFAGSGINDSVIPVNNALISGVGTTPTFFSLQDHSSQFNFGYAQQLHTGTSLNVTFSNTRTSSSISENFFNPAIQSTFTVGFQQPLLRGFGLLPNMRFILEARNTTKVGKLQFEESVIAEVTQVETQYWILVADRQAVDVAKQTLAVSQKLYDDDQRQLQIGTLAHLDVVTAESEIAANNQALIAAQTSALQQETVVLNLITKDPMDPRLQNVEIVPTTTLDEIPQVPNILIPDAVKEAWTNRPELKVDQLVLDNDGVEVRATRNALLPSLTLSGSYSSTGLAGINTNAIFTPNGTLSPILTEPIIDQNGNPVLSGGVPTFVGTPNGTVARNTTQSGVGTAYSDVFHNRFPTYQASLNLSLPLRNRSAQAANAQAQLSEREQQVSLQRDKNTIVVGVRQALTALQQDAAQVVATAKATQLAQETYDDEVKKFDLGASTTYNVVLQSRDLNAAKLNELQAKTNLAAALVNFNQAMGRTLSANNIYIADNVHMPIDFTPVAPLIPGTINGQLAGSDVFGIRANQ